MPRQPEPKIESLPLQIETPVIDIQDLEHDAAPETRVSNAGVRIEPHIDAGDERDLASEDELALEALEQFEKQLKQQSPG